MTGKARWIGPTVLLVILGLVIGFTTLTGLRTAVYSARTAVILIGPQENFRPNPIENAPPDLPVVAALVVLRLNDGPTAPIAARTEATLYGLGTWQGTRVSLRNLGSQWSSSFGEPIIDIEVVGPTPEWVSGEIDRQVERATTELDRLQTEVGVGAEDRVSATLSSPRPDVFRVGSSRLRLLGSMGCLYAVAVILVVRHVRRREEH